MPCPGGAGGADGAGGAAAPRRLPRQAQAGLSAGHVQSGLARPHHIVLARRYSWIANAIVDYSLSNPDTLTKYKTAAQISEKVLAAVSKLCVPGAKIVDICQQGDKLLEEEIAKVYRGKKINKGQSLPQMLTRSRPLIRSQAFLTLPPSPLLPS